MEWFFQNIPKIVHFYWGNDKLSFLRFMSIKSFSKYNPDWEIQIHVPAVLGKTKPTWSSWEQQNVNITQDFTDEMKKINCKIVTHDFSQHGFSNAAHEVHKADFIRWYLLATDGGVWSDIDIVYTKPMTSLVENIPDNRNIHVALVPYSSGGHTIGFLMSSGRGNAFYLKMYNLAKRVFDPNQYEGIGCSLINNNFPHLPQLRSMFQGTNFIFLNDKCVYSINWQNVNLFFDSGVTQPAPDKSIGYHWYAGHPLAQEWDSKLSIENYLACNSIISNAIKDVLSV